MRREIAGALEHRAGGLAQVHAELGRDDVRERRLAEARRAEDEHVIERLGRAARAALMKISSCSLTGAWPTYSSSRRGRMARSTASSSALGAALMMRSDVTVVSIYSRTAPWRARRISSSVECVPVPAPLSKRVASPGRYPSATRARVGLGLGTAGAAGARGARRQLRCREPIAHLHDQPLGGLAPDAGNARERRDVLGLHALLKLAHADARKQAERNLRSHARRP